MQTALIDEIPWTPYPGTRTTTTLYKGLLKGDPDGLNNYELAYEEFGEGGAISPRHRHNFEQFRWAFDEPLNFSPKQDILPGHLGYFPEGTYYGPQHIVDGCHMLILQFGGPSKQGYIGWDDLFRGTEELKQKGEFIKGVYTTIDASGKKHNKDAYEAVWEHIKGTQVAYPAGRYREPVVINPDAYSWVALGQSSGVSRRALGTFNEFGTGAFQLKLRKNSVYAGEPQPHIALHFVLSGTVSVGDDILLPKSAFSLDPNERAEVKALADAVILGFTLPDLSVPVE